MIRSQDPREGHECVVLRGMEFAFDDIQRFTVKPFDLKDDTVITLRVSPQSRSLKMVLLLFVEYYTAGARDTENCLNPDNTKMSVAINASPNRIYNSRLEPID